MLLLPWLGVGAAPAVIALALLAIPPIVIAVDLGIRGVSPAALDAATGMGMTPVQRFARVVVPLALPVSFAGLRTATTETIASATLATFIGAGGLGDEIVRGLQTDDPRVALRGGGDRCRARTRRRLTARVWSGGAPRRSRDALARGARSPYSPLRRCSRAAPATRRPFASVRRTSPNRSSSRRSTRRRSKRAGMHVERLFNLGSTQIAIAAMRARRHRLLSRVHGHGADRRAAPRAYIESDARPTTSFRASSHGATVSSGSTRRR